MINKSEAICCDLQIIADWASNEFNILILSTVKYLTTELYNLTIFLRFSVNVSLHHKRYMGVFQKMSIFDYWQKKKENIEEQVF